MQEFPCQIVVRLTERQKRLLELWAKQTKFTESLLIRNMLAGSIPLSVHSIYERQLAKAEKGKRR